jgi:hypothetical protein
MSVLLLATALAGCGYQFTAKTFNLPPDIHSIRVGEITNRTRQFGLEKSLAFALEREIVRRGTVDLVEEHGGGDAVITGAIRTYELRPVAFDKSDEALQYEVAIVADLHLQRSTDGHVLWQAKGLRESEEYSAIARVVVTSSAQFQNENLDAPDLAKFTDIALADSQKRKAVERLLDSLARDAYALMVEDF